MSAVTDVMGHSAVVVFAMVWLLYIILMVAYAVSLHYARLMANGGLAAPVFVSEEKAI